MRTLRRPKGLFRVSKPILALLAALLLFGSCEDKKIQQETLLKLEESESSRRKLERQVEQLSTEVEKTKAALEKAQAENEAQNAAYRKSEAEKAESTQRLETERDQERKKAEDLKKEFDEYRNKYSEEARRKNLGVQLAELSDRSGTRKFEQVTISKITPTTLSFFHKSGGATLTFDQLDPDFATRIGLLSPEASTPKGGDGPLTTPLQGRGDNTSEPMTPVPNRWEPTSLDEVAKCCLLVIVDEKVTATGEVLSGGGSAFLCNFGNCTYILSNAHNFDGTRKFRITDEEGREYSDFAGIDIATSPHGYNEKFRMGGDVVRIRLNQFRPYALTFDPTLFDAEKVINLNVGITGNTRGENRITRLTGKVTGLRPRQIIDHNVPTEGGNSGSPIVRMDNFRVIGILTWGAYQSDNPIFQLWKKESDELREGINSGALLYGFQFEPTTFEALVQQREVINRIKELARFLGLLDALIPSHDGVFLDRSLPVQGEYSLGDLVDKHRTHPIIQRLSQLDALLKKRADSAIKYSNRDMIKFWRDTMQDCLQMVVDHRHAIESRKQNMHFFYQLALDRSFAVSVCKAYERGTARTIAWYTRQLGTSGQPIPLAERVRLPSINAGFAAWGIQDAEPMIAR